MVISFGRALSLSRVLWKSAYSSSNMKPKSIAKQARKWIEQLFCSATLHVPFILHLLACIFLHVPFICMHVPFMILSCSFHLYSCSFIFLSYTCTFHVHSNVHSCPFIFLSFACMFLSFCIHVLSCAF